jgi:hypothetical protein
LAKRHLLKKQNLLKPVTAVLLLPLMFSLLLVSCNKKKAEEPLPSEEVQEEPLEQSLDDGQNFYSPAEDDASWVESLLARIEEERIAEELARMEESLSEYQLEEESAENTDEELAQAPAEETPPVEEPDPIEKFFEEAQEGRVINGKNNELRFYEFQNETLSPQITEKGYTIIHSSNENVQRYFYDLDYHLVKKEEWIIRSASDSKLTRTEEYVYSEESGKVIKKNISTDKLFESVSYNKDSLPVSLKSYEIKDKERYIVNERSWKYNEKNQLLKDEQIEYKYKNEDYTGGLERFTRRYEYTYYETAGDKENAEKSEKSEKSEIPPDLKYYENNELKMQYNYTDKKGTYYSWVYFDENFSVKTYYEDDIKVLEEFYNQRKLVRTKAYDKMD